MSASPVSSPETLSAERVAEIRATYYLRPSLVALCDSHERLAADLATARAERDYWKSFHTDTRMVEQYPIIGASPEPIRPAGEDA